MNLQLPPERDLPARALRAIESALVAEVTTARGAPRRRWLAPVAAAVAVIVTLGVVVGVLRGGDEDHAEPATPPSASPSPSRSLSPSPSPTRSVEQPTGRRDSIVPGCIASYGLGGTPEEKARANGAELYNLFGTPSDGLALIYTEKLAIYCTVGGNVMAYNAGGGPVPSMDWIPDPYRIDFRSTSRETDRDTRMTTIEEAAGGRVSEKVARVTLESGDEVEEAHLENGTFVVRVAYTVHSIDAPPPATLRAYDAAGKALPDPNFPECLRTPDGRIINNADIDSGRKTGCAPAVAWP